jgi:hypothetical protein
MHTKIDWIGLKYDLHRKFSKVYYPIKDWFFPWNVIKLRKLDRSWADVDKRMEEVILQLLQDFFSGEQPFHVLTGTPYEKNPSLVRTRELLNKVYEAGDDMDAEQYAVWSRLVDIAEWYERDGHHDDGTEKYIELTRAGCSHRVANMYVKAINDKCTENINFVVSHRGWLWT